jgi:N-carbamoylputrescine amidase
MNVTVCEIDNDPAALDTVWQALCDHVCAHKSDLVLLPEMPFYRWLAATQEVSVEQWEAAVQAHLAWVDRLGELDGAVVAGTRPVVRRGKRLNVGFVWDPEKGLADAHTKVYLPDEPGFWEASWYSPGPKRFESVQTTVGKIGFQICTEIWFGQHARQYGKEGVQILVCPRATPHSTTSKWVAGGRTAAVVSGAYCLSSNRTWRSVNGGDASGVGWIVEPGKGEVLGLTSQEQPFLTLEVDLSEADRAKSTYPRYIAD